MDSIRKVLAHAVRLEAEAARRFDELAEHMATHGNRDVEAAFRQFADFSRLHLKEAMARAGFRHIADKFDTFEGHGPTCVRRFVEDTHALGDRTPEQWQQDAFGQIDALLRAMALRD